MKKAKKGITGMGTTFVVGMALAMFVVLALMPAVSAQSTTLHFVPQHSSVEGYGDTTLVEIRVNVSATEDLRGGQFALHYDQSCGNITGYEWSPRILQMLSRWNAGTNCHGYGYEWVKFTFNGPPFPSGEDLVIANITIQGNSMPWCKTDVNITRGRLSHLCGIQMLNSSNKGIPYTRKNGTFTCEGPVLGYSKELYAGWNLVSLPLTPEDNSTGKVLETVDYDAVFRYNATAHSFVNVSAGTMDCGTGYFVNLTSPGTWTYNGTEYYESMDVPLKKGLNMIGWLNCTKDISDALPSNNYVAKWNAAEQKFEAYVPTAPDGFNDFSDMDRGEGYFVSVKGETALIANC